MTGGRPRREWKALQEWLAPEPRGAPLPPQAVDVAVGEIIDWWGAAAKLRERANASLRRFGLTFSQWRMLHAVEVLVRERGDAVSQLAIRSRAHMDASTASRLMLKLALSGWLDWEPDCYQSSYRILATDKAQDMLAETRPEMLAIAQRVRGNAG